MHPRTVSRTIRWIAAAIVVVGLLVGTPTAFASPYPSSPLTTGPAAGDELGSPVMAWAAHWLGTLLGASPAAPDYRSVFAADDGGESGATEPPPPGSGLVPCSGVCTTGGPSSDPNG